MGTTVADIGEDVLLQRIAERIGPPDPGDVWAGDDAAVLRSLAGPLLWTTDAVVEHVDFELAYCSGYDIGWKAMAANVSDIAAMGGHPEHALATLFVPPSTELDLVDDLLNGLLDAATNWELSVVGGDLSGGRDLALSIALSGTPAHEPVLRSGGAAGEAICVTGSLGGAAGGLYLLRNGFADGSDALIRRQLRPQARAEEGVILGTLGVGSMIDISDGLLLDLARLCASGGVGCDVDPAAVPVDPELSALRVIPAAPDPTRLALAGGEDFELLFTIDPGLESRASELLAEVGTAMTRLGTVTAGPPMVGGRNIDEWEELGWDHLKGR
ncbi:MAG: thiamine-monophosphate kinase [Actinomycetota bacterium]|jgi:thiamine-monophosphate kinase|nr:thiamine-monophosphate kinase [Actinomycetota bacterium]